MGKKALSLKMKLLYYNTVIAEICTFAELFIIYSFDSNIDSAIVKSERGIQEVLEWYTATGMCANSSKLQIMISMDN